MTPKTKESWRRHYANRKETLSVSEQETQSTLLNQHLIDSALFRRSESLALYCSVKPEPHLKQMIDAAIKTDKSLYLPRYDAHFEKYHFAEWDPNTPLERGPFNILQPLSNDSPRPSLDLILVPGLAFDDEGNRLGHGVGIYDRLLLDEHAARIGVAFEYQRVPFLPSEAHDCPMNHILSETGLHSI